MKRILIFLGLKIAEIGALISLFVLTQTVFFYSMVKSTSYFSGSCTVWDYLKSWSDIEELLFYGIIGTLMGTLIIFIVAVGILGLCTAIFYAIRANWKLAETLSRR